MRSRYQTAVPGSEIAEFADDIRQLFAELGRGGAGTIAGECAPGIDVFETEDAMTVVVDLPGVDHAGVRVVARGDTLLIAGEKARRRSGGESSFHLVERGFGRFARTVRLGRSCDIGRAQATLAAGELRVVVPKIPDRRRRSVSIPVHRAHGDGAD